ncbi:MAG TPA: TetR/AcrR family transcriptional regulator [Candidatus Binatia bacterium]|nr:TetR/AcrR family transcriptional regulator [Candidatus Binatia bacterium]
MSARLRRGARTPARRAARSTPAPPDATTRERLIHAARKLLEDGGYAAASVQAIAERAGLAAGAMYRHFPSKAELFVEVFRDAAKRDLVAMGDAAASGGAIERLEAVVATFARRALRHRRLAWALVYEPVDPLVDEERLVYRREYCRHMAALLRAGIAAGEIPDQNAELSAAAVVGAIAESLVGPLSPVAGQIGSDEDLIATLVRFCRRSVGAGDGAALRAVEPVRRRARASTR